MRKLSFFPIRVAAALQVAICGSAMADIYPPWPCWLPLCLNDPRGMTAEPGCGVPIDKFFDHLRRGKGIPSCSVRTPAGDKNYDFTVSRETYEPCPEGSTPGMRGLASTIGVRIRNARVFSLDKNGTIQLDDGTPVRACVRNSAGGVRATTVSAGDSGETAVINLYEEITFQAPKPHLVVHMRENGVPMTDVRVKP